MQESHVLKALILCSVSTLGLPQIDRMKSLELLIEG